MLRSFVFIFISILFTFLSGTSQVDKIKFEVDGEQYLKIRKNAGGFNIIHQHNTQTSMFFGFNSGLNNIDDPMVFNSGTRNTAYGFNTLSENTSGFQNTAIGASALESNLTGTANTAIGFGALKDGTSMGSNVAIGQSALIKLNSGLYNIGIGNTALFNTNYGTRSIGIGHSAGSNDTSSVDNVYVGYLAGRGTTLPTDGYDRKENTMIGSYAGAFCETNGNVFLGYRAGYTSDADNQLYITNDNTDSLNTLIYGQFDNELVRINGELNIDGLYTMPTSAPSSGDFLRYSSGTELSWYNLDLTWEFGAGDDVVYEDGDVGVGIGNPIYKLDVSESGSTSYVARFRNTSAGTSSRGLIIQTGPNVNPNSSVYYNLFLDGNGTNIGGVRGDGSGGVMYSTTSDRRLKQNIKTFDKGLEIIAKMNPTTYQMKSNPTQEEIGFIAQELQEILPTVVGGNPNDDVDESPMTVDYGRMTPVIVAAVKEQQEIIESQQKLIEKLYEKLNQQDEQFAELKAEIAEIKGIAKK